MRFVTKTIHAWLDDPVALALVTLPFLLGLGASHPLALTISPLVGVTAFLLTVFTDHHLGIVRVLPYRFHLAVDLSVGILFLALPFALRVDRAGRIAGDHLRKVDKIAPRHVPVGFHHPHRTAPPHIHGAVH